MCLRLKCSSIAVNGMKESTVKIKNFLKRFWVDILKNAFIYFAVSEIVVLVTSYRYEGLFHIVAFLVCFGISFIMCFMREEINIEFNNDR